MGPGSCRRRVVLAGGSSGATHVGSVGVVLAGVRSHFADVLCGPRLVCRQPRRLRSDFRAIVGESPRGMAPWRCSRGQVQSRTLSTAAFGEERTVTTTVVGGVRRCVGGRAVLASRSSSPSCKFPGSWSLTPCTTPHATHDAAHVRRTTKHHTTTRTTPLSDLAQCSTCRNYVNQPSQGSPTSVAMTLLR